MEKEIVPIFHRHKQAGRLCYVAGSRTVKVVPASGRLETSMVPPCASTIALEIANASAALKTLDKDGDGQLARDEFCPPPPPTQNGGPANGDQPAPPDDAPAGPPPGE